MKKIVVLLLIGVVILSGSSISGFSISAKNREIHCKEFCVSFSTPSFKEVDNHTVVSISGVPSVLVKPSYYRIPMETKMMIFPFGTRIVSVECNTYGIHSERISKPLYVNPMPVIHGGSSHSYNHVEHPVSIDRWMDFDVGTGLIGQGERGVYLKINIYPIQYHPEENIIEWIDRVELKIDYTNVYPTPSYDEHYDLLILAPGEYLDALLPLVEHKNNRNVSTKLVILEDIYAGTYFPVKGRDNPEKIKYFIKDAIENWGITNVLLVGGSEQFPTRYTHVHVYYPPNPPDDESFVSDLYYADIYNETGGFSSWDTNNNDLFAEYQWGDSNLTDDLDLYPDVAVGRLACVNSEEVNAVVNKIINYEDNEAYKQDWFTNIILCGGDTAPNDDEDIDEGEYVNEAIASIMDGFTPIKIWASNGKLWRVSNIDDAIYAGAGFIDLSGHGNPSVWATHPHDKEDVWIPVGDYTNTHVSKLGNGDKLPIVVTDACSPFKFDAIDDCLGWSFVSNPNGGGISGFGCTGLSWGEEGKNVTETLTSKLSLNIFKAYKNGAITFGEMYVNAISNYISPNMDCGDYKSIEEWEPLGDPTLAIARESTPPSKPIITGPSSGKPGIEYTFNATASDPDGDQIYYMFDWGDGSYSNWLGHYNSGSTIQAKHSWDNQGTYEVRVKAKDIHGVIGPWSDPIPITMPKTRLIDRVMQGIHHFFSIFFLL